MNAPANTADYNVVDILDYSEYPADVNAVLSQAFTTRADLLSLQKQAESANLNLSAAKADRYPTLNLGAGYDYAGMKTPLSNGWNAGVNLGFDLFTGNRKTGRIIELENTFDSAKKQVEVLKLQITYDAQQFYLNLLEAKQAIDTSAQEIQQAKENLDIANARYTTGIGSPLEINDAIVMYGQARSDFVEALYDYKWAVANIIKTIGLIK